MAPDGKRYSVKEKVIITALDLSFYRTIKEKDFENMVIFRYS
jgi:hypothetical protein